MAVNYDGGDSGGRLRRAGFTQSPEGRNWYRRSRVLALHAEAGNVEYALKEHVLRGVGVVRENVGSGLVRFSWPDHADPRRDPEPGKVVDGVRAACGLLWGDGYAPRVSPDHLFGVNLDPISGQPFDAGGPAGFPRAPEDYDLNELAPRTAANISGEGVVVGVVDTGIARGAATGVETQDWLEGSFLATPGDIDTLNHKGMLGNQAGHGTFITGVLLQHAPGATIRVARALHPDGFGDTSEVAAAINRLGRSGIHVLSLSLGSFTRRDNSQMAVEEALRGLDSDIVVVAAAGNLRTGRPGETVPDNGDGPASSPVTTPRKFWPAALPKVVSIGALDMRGSDPAMADFSNFGGWVSAYTHGVDVFSTYLTRDDDRDPAGVQHFRGYAYWSGTSFAAPAVAGAIAARMQRDRVSAREAADRILNGAEKHAELAVRGNRSTRGSILRLTPHVPARHRPNARVTASAG